MLEGTLEASDFKRKEKPSFVLGKKKVLKGERGNLPMFYHLIIFVRENISMV